MVSIIDILANKLFPVKHNPGDINTFTFVSLRYKVKDSCAGFCEEYHYRFIYMKNGNYIVHKDSSPIKMDMGAYLGSLYSKLGMPFSTLFKEHIVTVSDEFETSMRSVFNCKSFKDILMKQSNATKPLIKLIRVEHISGSESRLHLTAGGDIVGFSIRNDAKLPLEGIRGFIPELLVADFDTEKAIKNLEVEELKNVFQFEVKDLAVSELLQMGIQWIEVAKFFGYEGPTEAIPAVVKVMQSQEPVSNCLTQMVDFMFDDKITWDVESQVQRQINGKAFGAEVSLRLQHTLGNFFIQGFIGSMKLRIFKTPSTVQVYMYSMSSEVKDFDMERSSLNFMPYQKEKFFDWIKQLAERQAPSE